MLSGAERVQKHREGMRARGFRLIQFWIPDTRRLGFAQECRRQSCALAGDPHEKEILDQIETQGDFEGWR